MSSHEFYQDERDEQELRKTMNFVSIFLLFVVGLTIFAAGYLLASIQAAALGSEALSK